MNLLIVLIALVSQAFAQDVFTRWDEVSGFFSGNDGGGSSGGGNSGSHNSDPYSGTYTHSSNVRVPNTPPPTRQPPTPCYDKNTHGSCGGWKKLGYCEEYSRYYPHMVQECQKTCEFCYDATPYPRTPEPGNLYDNCRYVQCAAVRCASNEVLSQGQYDCCPTCVPQPHRGCTPVYKTQMQTSMYYKGYKCESVAPIVQSACFGVCASASVLLGGMYGYDDSYEVQRCLCCKSSSTTKLSTVLQCQSSDGYDLMRVPYEYEVILECDCSTACEPDNVPGVAAYSAYGRGTDSGHGSNSKSADQTMNEEWEGLMDVTNSFNL